ncbi:hypothetical protein Zmor_026979 [Zophobas morio]|uniref:Uncharacterized protein n=1 Tax=Zophobas morio TaxID=2755281 RepID=A0AA38HV22_9CUCU|nr:hypothetical protein Zmor_026979 [Zophobas morio]
MICLKCSSNIDENNPKSFIKCNGCNRPVHINSTCSDLTANEIKCFSELRPNNKRRIKYICLECDQGLHQLPKLLSLVKELREEISQLKELNKSSSTNLSTINQNNNLISTTAFEEIIHEISERNKRANNFILYNSKDQFDSKQDRIEHDTCLVKTLLADLNIQEQEVNPIRLGKFDRTKQSLSRPIKVQLSSKQDVLTVITKFKKLKESPNYASLSVFFDRTPRQSAFYKSVKRDLDTRIQNSETNLRIKYHNGVPTIVSEN